MSNTVTIDGTTLVVNSAGTAVQVSPTIQSNAAAGPVGVTNAATAQSAAIAAQTTANAAIPSAKINVPNGVAGLDSAGNISGQTVLATGANTARTLAAIGGDVAVGLNLKTVAALRALTDANTAPTAIVQNYATVGDLGGGPFVYNSNDTTSADNGGTIIVDTAGRRWYRQYSCDVQFEWFGPDFTGANLADTQLAAALAAVSPSGVLRISRQGTIKLSRQIVKSESFDCWSIIGPSANAAGSGGITFSYAGLAASTSLIYIQGGSGTTIRPVISNINFEGNSTSTAIEIDGQDGVLVDKCYFGTNAIGVNFHNKTPGAFTEMCRTRDCQFTFTCFNSVVYSLTSGNNSFHGSGLENCLIQQPAGNTTGSIVINPGCLPYQFPIDVQWVPLADPSILIANNCANGYHVTCFGTINVEPSGETATTVCSIASGYTVSSTGNVVSVGALYYGSFVLHDSVMATGPESNNGGIITRKVPYQGKKVFGNSTFTGAISGTTLTVSGTFTGANLSIGSRVDGTGVTTNTYITAFVSGTGGLGTYTVSNSQTVTAEAMTVTATAVGYGVFNIQDNSTLSCDLTLEFIGNNYQYAYDLKARYAGGNNGYVTTIAAYEQFNSAGWGAPTFTVDSLGNFVVTNTSASFSVTLNAFIRENGTTAYNQQISGQYQF